jgi:hypothetical protein
VGPEGDNIKLVVSNGCSGKWIALSHCWGKVLPVKTESTNFRKHCQEGLPLNGFTQTFSDAILLTRALGIQYLWIDALCIIQDSKEDWKAESMKMDYVYQNSFVTIAAEAAEDGSKGIFGSAYLRKPLSVLLQSQFHSITKGLRGTIYFRANWEAYDGANRGALSNRAWCLQEEILSPRILRFGKSQILWKCAAAEWREWRPMDERGNRFDFSRSLYTEISGLPELNRDWIITPSEKTKRSLFEYWYMNIVNFYVGRQITFPTDKFIALAGIANVVQDYLSGIDYKAGMWVEDIHSVLAWGTPKSNVTAYSEYVAPSWSWAHLDCSSEMPRQYFLYDINLVRSFTSLATILRIFNRDIVTRETLTTIERLALKIRGEYCDVCSCIVE